MGGQSAAAAAGVAAERRLRRIQFVRKSPNPRRTNHSNARQSAFAEELAKAL